MPNIILRMPQETLERIDMLKARIELQERRSLHRSTVLLQILDAGCTVLELGLGVPTDEISPSTEHEVIPSVVPIKPISQHMTIMSEAARVQILADAPEATIAPIAQVASAPETPAHPDLTEEVLEMLTGVSYDARRYKLGKLCPREHEYEGTGQSLLYRRNSVCVTCDREKVAERRQAKRKG